jgi:23S rRNA-/tRNA-specific pseudouridylate synthase
LVFTPFCLSFIDIKTTKERKRMHESWLKLWKDVCLNKRCHVLSVLPDGILALCKPCGMLSHPNPLVNNGFSSSRPYKTVSNTIINGSYNYKTETFLTSIENDALSRTSAHLGMGVIKSLFQTHLLHRFDKGTSGVILVSTDATSAKLVKSLFKERLVKKEYYAVVLGLRVLSGKRETFWEDPYQKVVKHREGTVRATFDRRSESQTNQIARTKVIIEHENYEKRLTLLRLQPHTGFSHQLRYQCALHYCPIAGDDVYGNFAYNKEKKFDRLYLHSHKIEFTYRTGQVIAATAPMPSEFWSF